MPLKINSNCMIFDQIKQLLNNIDSFSYGIFLLNLHGLWISDKELWFQWYVVQAKIIEPICLQEYMILEDYKEKKYINNSVEQEEDKYSKMLKMGVPKEAVERQRQLDMNNQVKITKVNKLKPPPPPPLSLMNQTKIADSPIKIKSEDLQNVKLKKVKEREKPEILEDKQMGYFEPPSLGDIQNMLKKLKPIN